MIDYTELKRMAEACQQYKIDFNEASPHQGSTSCDKLVRYYMAAASPDVVLGLIKELEYTTMAAEAEAKELDERNAEVTRLKGHIKHIGNDALRKENHALLTALEQAEASLSDYNCNAPYGRYDADVLNNIRAVITKARERI